MQLNSKQLLSVLQKVGSVVLSSSITPIISDVLLESTGSDLIFTGTNLRQQMRIKIDLSCETGKWMLPYEKLTSLLKMSGDCPIDLTFKDGSVTAQMEGKKFKFATEDAKDFPKELIHKDNDIVEFNVSELKEAITIGLSTVSTDDLRPAMSGLYFNGFEMCGTDGHVLMVYKFGAEIKTPFIAPASFCKTLLSFMDSETISISVGSKTALARIGDIELCTTLIDERYPDYQNAIPTNNPIECNVSSADLNRAVKRSLICSNKTTSSIEFNFGLDGVNVKSQDLDFSLESIQEVACKSNESIRIGINGKMLSKVLDHMKSDVVIEMSQPNRAMIIRPNDKFFVLVMPVMLND